MTVLEKGVSMGFTFHERSEPRHGHGVPFPTEWLEGWMRETHAQGRRRLGAVAAFHQQLSSFGVMGSVLVGGEWMAADDTCEGVRRIGPIDGPAGAKLWAEGAGELSAEWLGEVLGAFLDDPRRLRPSSTPRLYRVEGEDPPALLFDLSAAGRRTGFVIASLTPEALPAVETLLDAPVIRWVVPAVSGLLRSEQFRVHWDTLSGVLVGRGREDWEAAGTAERPVNAQEVVHRVSKVASGYAADAARAFEAATVGVFLPDPDDEYVYCFGGAGTERYAYDAGVHPHKPAVEGVEFGLTPSYVVGAAWDPAGGQVVVRDLPDRESMKTRYRDLGFDEEAVEGRSERPAPMLAERFVHPPLYEAALKGPWVFTAQQLPRFLSPTGRNLVVRFQGRTASPVWSGEEEVHRTNRDRRLRMASLVQRIHDDLCGQLAQGLTLWREGLREEVQRELATQQSWSSVCQILASWLSCRAVSIFRLDGGALNLLAWSLPQRAPALRFDPTEALLDAAELRLLQAPLFPHRHEVSPEGFLGWPAVEEELAHPSENVGCVPVVASGQPVGLLRVDGAMSLFGGLLRRGAPQGGLHHHRPTAIPWHIRSVLDEVARLLSLALRPGLPSEWSDWTSWVERARRGHVPADEVVERIDRLRAQARTRIEASHIVGVHRNTFRRQLSSLADVLELDELRW